MAGSETPCLSWFGIEEAVDGASPWSVLRQEDRVRLQVSRDPDQGSGCAPLLPPPVRLTAHHCRLTSRWVWLRLFISLSAWVVCNQLVWTWDHNVLPTTEAMPFVAFLPWKWKPLANLFLLCFPRHQLRTHLWLITQGLPLIPLYNVILQPLTSGSRKYFPTS